MPCEVPWADSLALFACGWTDWFVGFAYLELSFKQVNLA